MDSKMPSGGNSLLVFLMGVLNNYRETGAIAPSSNFLARKIVGAAGVGKARSVLEIGPGTGVFTREVLRVLPEGAQFAAVEKNPRFAKYLRGKFPGVEVVEGCATQLDGHMARTGMKEADSVVSGLPWAAMPESLQDTLLERIHGVLASGGIFATFAYFGPHWLPSGRGFRQRLRAVFSHTATTTVEPRNLPPAFVYVAGKTPPDQRAA